VHARGGYVVAAPRYYGVR